MNDMDDPFQKINTLESDIKKLKRSLTCEICSELLGSPFMLLCGHIFCYGCILDWLLHKRICPTCRRSVSHRPALAYFVQEMVDVFVRRMELLDPEGEGKASRLHQQEQRQRMEKNKESLFFDLFVETSTLAGVLCDREDGVMRCMGCYWEIEGSVCAHCGFQFSDEDPDSFDNFSRSDVLTGSESHGDGDSLCQDSVCSEPDDYDYNDPFIDDRPTDELECCDSDGQSNGIWDSLELDSYTAGCNELDGTDHDSLIQEQIRRTKRSYKRKRDFMSNAQSSKNCPILIDSDENVNVHKNGLTSSNIEPILISPSSAEQDGKHCSINLFLNSPQKHQKITISSDGDINEHLTSNSSIPSLRKNNGIKRRHELLRHRRRMINNSSSTGDLDE